MSTWLSARFRIGEIHSYHTVWSHAFGLYSWLIFRTTVLSFFLIFWIFMYLVFLLGYFSASSCLSFVDTYLLIYFYLLYCAFLMSHCWFCDYSCCCNSGLMSVSLMYSFWFFCIFFIFLVSFCVFFLMCVFVVVFFNHNIHL